MTPTPPPTVSLDPLLEDLRLEDVAAEHGTLGTPKYVHGLYLRVLARISSDSELLRLADELRDAIADHHTNGGIFIDVAQAAMNYSAARARREREQ